MKVLLIKPLMEIKREFSAPETWFPDGLLYVGTLLKKNNINTRIIDLNVSSKDYIYEIESFHPDIVGIGCFSSEAFGNLLVVSERIKSIYPEVKIAIGGIHPTIFAAEILKKYGCIDYVVVGEGETAFLELIRKIENNVSMENIDGIVFRENGSVKYNHKTKYIEKLDILPFVDYGIIDLEDYSINTKHWYSPKGMEISRPFSILSSRSCPERCNFCSMFILNGPKIRFRSANNVVDEMQNLFDKYGANYFHFIDDNMTYDQNRMLGICSEITERKLNIQFDTPNGISIKRLSKEVIDAMVSAGLVRVSLAIESGSDYIRNEVIRKNLSREKIYEIVNYFATHRHVYIKLFFIIGFPEETKETLEDTYRMIKELPHDFPCIHFATPYPGTRLFDDCVSNNLLPYGKEEYVDMSEFHHDPAMPHFKPYNLSKKELVRFRNKCYRYINSEKAKSGLPRNYPMRMK